MTKRRCVWLNADVILNQTLFKSDYVIYSIRCSTSFFIQLIICYQSDIDSRSTGYWSCICLNILLFQSKLSEISNQLLPWAKFCNSPRPTNWSSEFDSKKICRLDRYLAETVWKMTDITSKMKLTWIWVYRLIPSVQFATKMRTTAADSGCNSIFSLLPTRRSLLTWLGNAKSPWTL